MQSLSKNLKNSVFSPLGQQKVPNKKTFHHPIDNHYLGCYTEIGYQF
jgi:hypothetical protein